MTVVHVVSSASFAQKCEEAGCDAIVAEGFEAGGHNGREETSTLTLIPNVAAHCRLPLIAAGRGTDRKPVRRSYRIVRSSEFQTAGVENS